MTIECIPPNTKQCSKNRNDIYINYNWHLFWFLVAHYYYYLLKSLNECHFKMLFKIFKILVKCCLYYPAAVTECFVGKGKKPNIQILFSVKINQKHQKHVICDWLPTSSSIFTYEIKFSITADLYKSLSFIYFAALPCERPKCRGFFGKVKMQLAHWWL